MGPALQGGWSYRTNSGPMISWATDNLYFDHELHILQWGANMCFSALFAVRPTENHLQPPMVLTGYTPETLTWITTKIPHRTSRSSLLQANHV